MSGRLARYLRKVVGLRTLWLTAFLIALMQVLELMDMTTEVLDRGLGVKGLAYYAALRVPSEVMLALPLAALLGAMWAFHDLTRSHEMVAIRTAGVSLRRIVLYLLPVPLVVAAAYIALSQAIAPQAETVLQSWWVATAPPDDKVQARWIRTKAGPVSYASASPDGSRLAGVRIYVLGENALLARRIFASSAEWQDGAWHLEGVRELTVPGVQAPRDVDIGPTWKTNLHPDDVQRAEIARPKLSSGTLLDVIAGERTASQPLSYYQTALLRSFLTPLVPFIMLLLALPAARGLPRRSDGSAALLLALGLGLAFLLCDGFMAALGTSGRVNAALAALAAPVLFAGIGLIQLRFSEGR